MEKKLYDWMDWPRIEAVIYGEEDRPREVMGPRVTPDGILIQGYFPGEKEVFVLTHDGRQHEMSCRSATRQEDPVLPVLYR